MERNDPPKEAPPPPPPLPQQLQQPPQQPHQTLSVRHVERKPSILLPHLQQNEKQFFEFVASGDVLKVEEFLAKTPDFNINCVNFQGVSALLIAVQSHSEGMVDVLLHKKGIEVGDCALHAVRDNNPKILELLLNKVKQISPSLEFVGVTHSTDFADHVTPLMLAAQCGHYEIIEMLIERGHTIARPHHPTCRCSECKLSIERDDLLHAETMRLNLYKAISNPAYICHSTMDPILEAFELSRELRECSFLVPEFRTAYADLADGISNFAVDLIACSRSTTEMEIILSQTRGDSSSSVTFPRLVMAIDYKQKAFVAHPNTQQLIEQAWIGTWHEYKLKPKVIIYLYPFVRILLLPVITVMSIVSPNNAQLLHWNLPLNKMISHIAGYICFLLLIFLESNKEKTGQKRMPPRSGLEPFIILFVIGFIWNSIRMCMLQGPKRYFKYLWNWHAIINNMLFALTFFFWLASYFDYVNYDQVDLERKYWHHLDPVLISEGTFCVATIMAFFKLMFFCRLNYYLGPLQISLGKMCADMAKYITIFIIIIFSFTAGLCRFYQYYDGMVQIDSNGIKTAQVASFVNFASTMKTFFWALLCMSPLESADVIIENLPGETEKTTIINEHGFTETVGYIAFGLYEVLTVVMILNMLIATMSSTFQRVIDNLDIEWTFGKTDFYLEYMMQTSTPSPFNLIPTPVGISTFMEMWSGNKEGRKNDAVEEQDQVEYPALMSLLIQRYFREKDTENAAATEFDILKQEIHELKTLLKEIIEE